MCFKFESEDSNMLQDQFYLFVGCVENVLRRVHRLPTQFVTIPGRQRAPWKTRQLYSET